MSPAGMQIVGPDYYLNLADASANHVNEKRKPRSDDVFGVTRFPSEEMHLTKILKHCKLTCYFSFIFISFYFSHVDFSLQFSQFEESRKLKKFGTSLTWSSTF